jgi:hypothetical protein
MIPWHRLLGLALSDYFQDAGWRVEVEKDLALKRQLLDVLIIEREPGAAAVLPDPCDGLEALRPHNLLTYKSLHEPLDTWAVQELIGHYVNYRKNLDDLLPPDQFGLYAVSARYPAGLARHVDLVRLRSGLYRLSALNLAITVVVLSEVEVSERNALWELFSHDPIRVAHGVNHYHWRRADYNTLFRVILQDHLSEGLTMSYTMEDLYRDVAREVLEKLPPEERLRGLPPEERLRGLPPEERLRGLPLTERIKGLSPEEILNALNGQEKRRLRELLAETGDLQ